MPFTIDSDGWIKGVTEYAGCGSHACDWNNEYEKALIVHAREMMTALEEIAEGDGCNCRVGPGCDWKCKDIARDVIYKIRSTT